MLAAALLLLAGCASPAKVNEKLLPHLLQKDYQGAIAELDKEKDDSYGNKDAFLYWVERGMLLHYDGDYEQSNAAFETAKRIAEENYTKSISAEASTWVANDNTRPYYGENFERALIHAFSALNYEALGDQEGALVEVRQLNFLLRKMDTDGVGGTYTDDAFAHYLAAIFFEEVGQPDEAFIAYKKASEAYAKYQTDYQTPPPPSLPMDMAYVAEELGGWATLEVKDDFGDPQPVDVPDGYGRAVVLHYNGRAPVKVDHFIDVAWGDGWIYANQFQGDSDYAKASMIASSIASSESFRVSFPAYQEQPRTIAYAEIAADGAEPVRTELVEDVGAIAVKDLEDRINKIRAKAIARAAIKYALNRAAEEAARQAGGDYGAIAALVVKAGGAIARNASEVADKRAWFTVPDQIWMAELVLPEGEHTLDVSFRDQAGTEVGSEQVSVEVESGERSFVCLRTVQ